MSMQKTGAPEPVLREPGEVKKTAASEQTDQDRAELAEENRRAE